VVGALREKLTTTPAWRTWTTALNRLKTAKQVEAKVRQRSQKDDEAFYGLLDEPCPSDSALADTLTAVAVASQRTTVMAESVSRAKVGAERALELVAKAIPPLVTEVVGMLDEMLRTRQATLLGELTGREPVHVGTILSELYNLDAQLGRLASLGWRDSLTKKSLPSLPGTAEAVVS
jgi:hypothetical protein